MTQCPSCGAAADFDARYCAKCGAPLTDDAPARPTPSGLDAEVLVLARDGRKIDAIKRYREATGSGLKEAKDAVEALMAEHGLAKQGAGCGSAVLLMLVLAGLGWLCIA